MTPKQRNTSSRRRVLQSVGALAAAGIAGARPGVLANPKAFTLARQADESPRVLALIGDRYHNSDYIRVCLDKLFHQLALQVDYTNYDQISRSLLAPYQLFVCLRDGMIWPGGYLGPDAYSDYERFLEPGFNYDRPSAARETPKAWITEEQGHAIEDFVKAGKGFYALHNSSHISLSSESYRKVMGGAYIGHPPLRPFLVRVTNKDHPITREISDFVVDDEQHYVEYDKDPANIFLRAENIDGLVYGEHGTKSISGWAHEYGKGRVVFTAVGHNIPAMWQSEYFKLQTNAVRWLLRLI